MNWMSKSKSGSIFIWDTQSRFYMHICTEKWALWVYVYCTQAVMWVGKTMLTCPIFCNGLYKRLSLFSVTTSKLLKYLEKCLQESSIFQKKFQQKSIQDEMVSKPHCELLPVLIQSAVIRYHWSSWISCEHYIVSLYGSHFAIHDRIWCVVKLTI